MKIILLLIAMFLISGCSEEKSSVRNTGEATSMSSAVQKQEKGKIRINELFSIGESAVKDVLGKPYNVYGITAVSYDEKYYNELFETLYGEQFSFERKENDNGSFFEAETQSRVVKAIPTTRSQSIFNKPKTTSKLWVSGLMINLNQQGLLDFSQVASDNVTVVQGKQLIEDFLKKHFNIQNAQVSYIYVDKPMIETFKKEYKKTGIVREDEEISLPFSESFVYYHVTPLIDDCHIFEGTVMGETGMDNSILGTAIDFIVKDSQIAEFDIRHLYPIDPKVSRQVSITQEELLNRLKSMLENRFVKEQVVIDSINVEYLPMIDPLNKRYEYKPTLVLSSSSNDLTANFPPFYIDIETGEEVKR
ncbi:hypothetical protein [Tuanshanicoccus lijuaniae]|uniref:hypothetical protein n=1 Tax=Aerococcaceae bacterium zg-1292 TaxID=2774330 RepID=UPI001BD8CFEC|nr:hypothetical protein [Aerococcaceae bacterium zg-A91]MBS4458158.1 hypothetical protein [Aerococcaceae bacterium zg-BR33]